MKARHSYLLQLLLHEGDPVRVLGDVLIVRGDL